MEDNCYNCFTAYPCVPEYAGRIVQHSVAVYVEPSLHSHKHLRHHGGCLHDERFVFTKVPFDRDATPLAGNPRRFSSSVERHCERHRPVQSAGGPQRTARGVYEVAP